MLLSYCGTYGIYFENEDNFLSYIFLLYKDLNKNVPNDHRSYLKNITIADTKLPAG